MIKKVILWHLAVVTPILAGMWYFFAMHQFASFSYGAAVVFVNTGLMMWGWSLIMSKTAGMKALLILGTKYMLLFGFIAISSSFSWLHTGFFLAGLSTFFIPLLGLSILWWTSFRPKKTF